MPRGNTYSSDQQHCWFANWKESTGPTSEHRNHHSWTSFCSSEFSSSTRRGGCYWQKGSHMYSFFFRQAQGNMLCRDSLHHVEKLSKYPGDSHCWAVSKRASTGPVSMCNSSVIATICCGWKLCLSKLMEWPLYSNEDNTTFWEYY